VERMFRGHCSETDRKENCDNIKYRAACSYASRPPASICCLLIGDKGDVADCGPKLDS
jgi:hypothetical protein